MILCDLCHKENKEIVQLKEKFHVLQSIDEYACAVAFHYCEDCGNIINACKRCATIYYSKPKYELKEDISKAHVENYHLSIDIA